MRQATVKTSLLALCTAASLLIATVAGAALVKVTVGGKNLDIPLPAGFVDTATAAPQLKQLGEKQFVSEGSRLLVYGVEQTGLERLKKGQSIPLQHYLQVQVPKQLEEASATPADFAELKKVVVQQNAALGKPESKLGALSKGKLGELVDAQAKQVQPGAPLTLGVLRDDERSYTVLTLSRFETKAGKNPTVYVLTATSYVLFKDKLLHFYLYADYLKPADAEWLRETSDAWLKAAL
ncbi:MAG: hypothetical protein KGZ83_10295 [Sulfuricella sp.]|nr:hypothetical protein [Sulfuricella sp.]